MGDLLQVVSYIRDMEARVAALERLDGPYTEGTWTPALAFGGASTGITYTARNGYYVRVGSIVVFECRVLLSSKGSATGTAQITGLPAVALINSACAITATGLAGLSGLLQALVVGGQAHINLYDGAHSAAAATASDADFANDSVVYLSGSYRVQ